MLLSIITINFNNAAGLKQTIESVISQNRKDVEFIVVDGNSADDSCDILTKYSSSISQWISEPDTGIYNAMNKAITISTGEYLLFLNSGDILHDADVLACVIPSIYDADIIYGNLLIREPGKSDWIKYYNEKLTFDYFTRDTLPHQASFIKRDLFAKWGMYDESFKICADWKFFMDVVVKHGAHVKYVNRVISIYDYTGISSRPEYHAIQIMEKDSALAKDYPMFYDSHNELQSLRQLKNHYEDLSGNFVVKKLFALMVKSRTLKRKLKKKFNL